MERKILTNKPLVEAIFEIRWELQETNLGVRLDPHYKILIGRIYDRVKDEYPFHEQLPTATIPDEVAGYVVQHRFRKGENEWPLVQIGPGILTLNDTEKYVWEDFEKRIRRILDVLFEAYPNAEKDLSIQWALLRYINSVNFDYERENIFAFLGKNLKTKISVHEELFDSTEVEKSPSGLDLRFSFPARTPKGTIHLRFARGKRKNVDVLIWEIQVQSEHKSLKDIGSIKDWIAHAHSLIDTWFFKMIEGELLRRFE